MAAATLFFGFMAFTGAPYLPSRRRDIEQAFTKLYTLSAKDHLVDFGAGDGKVLRAAVAHGARATGYEINPLIALVARLLSRNNPRINVKIANMWRANFPKDTTVVYIFGDSRDIARMYAKIEREAQRLGRPLMVISYGIRVPGKTVKHAVGPYFLYRVG